MHASTGSLRTRSFPVFEVDLRAAELRKFGIKIKLQEQPFQLLALLITHPGKLVTRDEIRQALWPGHTFIDFDRSLNKAVTKLRSALGDSAESPRYVEKVHPHGYRYLFSVSAITDASTERQPLASHTHDPAPISAMADAPPPAIAVPIPESTKRPESRSFVHRLRSSRLFLDSSLIAASAALFTYLWFSHLNVFGSVSRFASRRRSVAVLGFRNLSANPREAWRSVALSDWLTTERSAGEQLRTLLAENVARMKLELGRIEKNLGTDLVVLGSYATLGDKGAGQIRLDLRLLDARTGEVLAAQVAFALPSNPEAARFYSEGLAKLRVYDALATHELLDKSAWARQGFDESAKAEAKKAFDLSSRLSRAERLLVEGRYRETSLDCEKAIEIYRALFDFFPDNLEYGIALASAQVSEGKGKDARATVAALQALPAPLSDDARVDLTAGNAAESLGDFKRVETATERAIRNAAAAGDSLVIARAKLDQCWAFENLGQFDKVQAAVEEAKQLFIAAHDKLGLAKALTFAGIALEDQGDFLGAQKVYGASLAVYQATGRAHLAALQKEADRRGSQLVARRVAAALHVARDQASGHPPTQDRNRVLPRSSRA